MTRLIPSDAASPAAASVDLPPAVWIWHGLGRAGHGFPQALLEALGHVEPAVQPFAAGGVHREVVQAWRSDPPREADDKRLARVLKPLPALSHGVADCEPAVLRAMVAAAGRRPIRHLILSLSDPALRLADQLAGLPLPPTAVALVQQDRAAMDHLACTELALARAGVQVHRLAIESLAAGAPGESQAWQSLHDFLGAGAAALQGSGWPQRLRGELEATLAALDPAWQDRLSREAHWSAGLELPPAAVAPVLRAQDGPDRPVRLVKIDRLPAVLREGEEVRLAGVVVPAHSPSGGGKLWLHQAGERRRLNWGLASPGVAARLGDAEGAHAARFRPVGVRASRRHPVKLSLAAKGGARAVPVAELAFEPIDREPIEGIYLSRWSIGYQPIPKAACTSIKEMLFRMTVGQPFSPALADGARHVHNYFTQRHRDVSAAAFRFVVMRDPIKRFLSAYSSRVLRHRELSREKLSGMQLDPAIDWDDFPFDPDLETFVERFDLYRSIPTIAHHCRPVSEFCASLAAFDKVYPFERLRDVAADLQRLTGLHAELPHSQRASRIPLDQLPAKAFDKLVELYAADYEMLAGLYSPAALR
jgi:hypothetical protein